MKRTLFVAACALLALGMTTPAGAEDKRDPSTLIKTGDADQGAMIDHAYGGPNADMEASWNKGNRDYINCTGPACAGQDNPVWSTIHIEIHADSLPDTATGHATCLQVSVDWRVPLYENHYDMRAGRVCKPFGALIWNFSEKDTNNQPREDCSPTNTILQPRVPCSSPMGRVQFARYDRATGNIIGPIECRAMAGIDAVDCENWNPWGNPDASRMKILQQDGQTIFKGSLDATNPNA